MEIQSSFFFFSQNTGSKYTLTLIKHSFKYQVLTVVLFDFFVSFLQMKAIESVEFQPDCKITLITFNYIKKNCTNLILEYFRFIFTDGEIQWVFIVYIARIKFVRFSNCQLQMFLVIFSVIWCIFFFDIIVVSRRFFIFGLFFVSFIFIDFFFGIFRRFLFIFIAICLLKYKKKIGLYEISLLLRLLNTTFICINIISKKKKKKYDKQKQSSIIVIIIISNRDPLTSV